MFDLTQKEVGWIKYCLIRVASDISNITRKEKNYLWKLLEKVEAQEKIMAKSDDI